MKICISEFENDISVINSYLNSRGMYFDSVETIDSLYKEFCQTEYFATWLIIRQCYLDEFYDWIKNNKTDYLEFLDEVTI